VAASESALDKITHDASVSNLGALGKEADAYQTKLDRIYEVTDAALKNAKAAGADETKILADSLAAQEAVEKEHAENVAKIKADAAKKEQKEAKDAADDAADLSEKARDKKISDLQAVGQAVIGLGNDLIAATTKQYDTTTKEGRAAAEKQFKTQKAAQMAMAIVAGALAVSQALTLTPPLSFIMAGITGAAAAIQLGVIAAAQPKFHMGTTGMRPDEYTATLQRGEGVVTSAGMAKPGMRDVVAAANSGRELRGGGGSMSVQYQHKVYNEFIRDNLKAGSPLTRRIDSGTKVGHRQSRS
jgi:hypothetical protein